MINKRKKSVRVFAWLGAILFAVVLAVMPFCFNSRVRTDITYADEFGDSYLFKSSTYTEDFALSKVDGSTENYFRSSLRFSFDHSTEPLPATTSANYTVRFWFGSLRSFGLGGVPISDVNVYSGTYLDSSTNNFKIFANSYVGLDSSSFVRNAFFNMSSSYGSSSATQFSSTITYGSYTAPCYLSFAATDDFEFFVPIFYNLMQWTDNNGSVRKYVGHYQGSICVRGSENFITPRSLVVSYDIPVYFGLNNTYLFYCVSYKYYDENNDYFEILIPHDIVAGVNTSTSSTYYFYDSATDNDYYSQGYSDGYNEGLSDGDSAGYDRGYDVGYGVGETSGYNSGLEHSEGYSFFGLISSAVDVPVKTFSGLFDFNFSFDGVHTFNLKGFFLTLLTIAFVIMVIRFALSR